jgi:pimeloyl-ACP methyl ester carboxylesterase
MSNINYTERGEGYPVILLHGFPFHQQLWNDFAEKLSASFRVITPDLPGFGRSPLLKSPFTIEDVAATLLQFIEQKNLSSSVIVGHSLGGYVALAMVALKPQLFKGLVLFHSTAHADTEEKQQSRNKVLEFIEKNGVKAFTANFIPPLFGDQQHPAISSIREIATQASTDAVVGYTIAMRDRKERTSVLKKFLKPILFISGDRDGGISVDSIQQQAMLSPLIKVSILPAVAHMGMFETPDKTLEILGQFIAISNQR